MRARAKLDLVSKISTSSLSPGAAPGTTPPGRTTVGTNNDWNHMTLTAGEFTADSYEDLVAVDDRTPGKLWVYPGTATGGLGARELLRSLS